MYIKLDAEVEKFLCCSFCKSDLVKHSDYFRCQSCGLKFPKRGVKTHGNTEEFVFDFRISRPTYCTPAGVTSWDEAQFEYEQYHQTRVNLDVLKTYADEIASVQEIYTTEYRIEGRVLDVGGHQGRLRHFLKTEGTTYVSVDPFINIFAGIGKQPNLLRAYPCLLEPCNFVSAHAEYLPFKSETFDWVHMRSVVDHFADPYLAFLEAYRCSKLDGKLLVGLAIQEKQKELAKVAAANSDEFVKDPSLPRRVIEKVKREGPLSILRAILDRAGSTQVEHKDDHMFRLTQNTLRDLFAVTGWNVVKEHWQKPPSQFCIYACGEKGSEFADK